jgi:hypothetical protein
LKRNHRRNRTAVTRSGDGMLDSGVLRNLGRAGRPVGSSQITAVVERAAVRHGAGLPYPMTARAELVAPYAVELVAPRLLSPHEKELLDEVSLAGKAADDWMTVAGALRRADLREQLRPLRRNPTQPKIEIRNRAPLSERADRSPAHVTSEMRHFAETGATDHIISGFPVFVQPSRIYMRGRKETRKLRSIEPPQSWGSSQKGYFNMLRQAGKWGHVAVVWDDPARGRVYKLIFNPNHNAPRAADPPADWMRTNAAATLVGVKPISF